MNNTIMMQATNPEFNGSILSFYDHYPDCPEANLIAQFDLATLDTVQRGFIGSDSTKLGVKYEGDAPLPDDVNLPIEFKPFTSGNVKKYILVKFVNCIQCTVLKIA